MAQVEIDLGHLTTTPWGLLMKVFPFLFSLILFFQSKTNLKLLGTQTGIDPDRLGLEHLTLHYTTRATADSSYFYILPNPSFLV